MSVDNGGTQYFANGVRSATGKANPSSKGGGAKGTTKNGPSFGFNPSVNLSSNRSTTVNNGGGSRPGGANGRSNGGMPGLPDPDFSTPAGIREYCNHLRTVAFMLAAEVAVAAEIMKGTLGQVPAPDGSGVLNGSRARAWKVSRKLDKSADALMDAAKNAAATYAAFQQQFEEELNRVRHTARRPQARRMDWNQQ
ncbi:plasmid transfer protein TraA [Streptomyces goshikiensis]|uniref:plasmid transfer protein TraA n=1 Tax=Streptomyces goshikiensis TaxID=1942 RepID=UPI0036B1F902